MNYDQVVKLILEAQAKEKKAADDDGTLAWMDPDMRAIMKAKLTPEQIRELDQAQQRHAPSPAPPTSVPEPHRISTSSMQNNPFFSQLMEAGTPKIEAKYKTKFSVLCSLARQVEGEFVFLNIVKASTDSKELEEIIHQGTLPRTQVIGEIPCLIEYGVMTDLEIEVSETEVRRLAGLLA